MSIMTVVGLVVNIREKCRDLRLPSTEIQLQLLYKVLCMLEYRAL